MDLKKKVLDLANKFYNEVVEVRRHIHQNPELSFQEFKTSAYLAGKLNEKGIPFKSGFVKTGIVAIIEGKNPKKKLIALRGDMDALPITEVNNLEYKSTNHGVMHACGHDVHASSLFGTGLILNAMKEEFEGTIKLIFQPGEEKLPGGAKLMLEEGIFADGEPDMVIGQHVQPNLPVGSVGFKPGIYMASTDELYLTVKGKGGHAGMPHQLTDPVLIASHVIIALQQIVSRNALASMPTVLSFGRVIANGATNIIPEDVTIEGTFRTMDELWREEAHDKMIKVAKSIARGMGGDCIFEIKKGYPYLVNHEETTLKAKQFATKLLGEDKIIDLDIRMTAEDFAYFSQKYPCTFYRLGVQAPNDIHPAPLHSPNFMVDENALYTGFSTMAWIALNFMKE